METKVYVGNLAYGTTEQNLRDLFMEAGNVASVVLVKDPGTNRSRGFAFVEMTSQSEAQKAIILFNGYTVAERPLSVSMARPREAHGGFHQKRRTYDGS